MMPRPVLQAEAVEKRYGNVRALRGVDVHVKPGEFVVLLGPNGAGKTTLFQVLTGLFAADAGHVRIAGQDLRRHPVKALAASGVVFQQPTIDLDMSVVRNLRFHALLHGMPRKLREARIAQALQEMQLEACAKQPVRKLSGGNRRRVELARALLHEPALLLMDEPSVGLDPASRRDLVDRVHVLCERGGPGVLWATHLVDEAERADRVVVLHQGQVLADLSPQALLAKTTAENITDAFLVLTGDTLAVSSSSLERTA